MRAPAKIRRAGGSLILRVVLNASEDALRLTEFPSRIRDGSAYAIALDGVGYLTELSTVGSDRRARPFAGRQYACALLEQAVRFVGRLLSAYFEKTT
ncbi:MAG TPA: hypothetical protein VGA09_04415 [Candidatus Binatia bacterium]